MRLLVIGGTVFLGRHVVEVALHAGHAVTLFHRGRTQPWLFPDAEHVHGDRDGGLGALGDRRWDAIVDTCGFVPRVVAQSAALRSDRYVFVSTVSVYADLATVPDVGSPVAPAPDHEDVQAAYGGLKAACERVVQARHQGGACIVRPGLIGGPHDPTGRFTYWPVRLAEGGDVLAPLPREAPAQVIDVRDLADWLVRLAEGGPDGIFHGVGERHTLAGMLEEIARAVGPDARLTWVDPVHLDGIEPWTGLPLWIPGTSHAGMLAVDPAPSVAAGLRLRPLAATARDTLAWARTLEGGPARQADGRYTERTLSREEERRRLAHARGEARQDSAR